MTVHADLYELLGVTPAASPAELGRAYRAQLWRHHPDTRADSAPGTGSDEAAEAIRGLLEAYAVLRDPVRRAEYDRQRARRAATGNAGSAPRDAGPVPRGAGSVPGDAGPVPRGAGSVPGDRDVPGDRESARRNAGSVPRGAESVATAAESAPDDGQPAGPKLDLLRG